MRFLKQKHLRLTLGHQFISKLGCYTHRVEEDRLLTPNHIRSFVLGVEDSLVSTVGLVSGIAAVGSTRATIILTGVILIFVEAFSMAVGELLADTTVKEFQEHQDVPLWRARISAVVMLVSYICSGFLVLSPYFFLTSSVAFYSSIAISLCALFVLGIATAELSRIHPMRKALTMAFVGGAAIMIGVTAGLVLQSLQ
jgi:VIT1/CCC1 family predicted Fe2+/Mn2+ transporter